MTDYLHYARTTSGEFHCFDTMTECEAWAKGQPFGTIDACYCCEVGKEWQMFGWPDRTRVVHHINEG